MRSFVRKYQGMEKLHVELPGENVPAVAMADALVVRLQEEGLITREFFAELRRIRPSKARAIQETAEAWGIELGEEAPWARKSDPLQQQGAVISVKSASVSLMYDAWIVDVVVAVTTSGAATSTGQRVALFSSGQLLAESDTDAYGHAHLSARRPPPDRGAHYEIGKASFEVVMGGGQVRAALSVHVPELQIERTRSFTLECGAMQRCCYHHVEQKWSGDREVGTMILYSGTIRICMGRATGQTDAGVPRLEGETCVVSIGQQQIDVAQTRWYHFPDRAGFEVLLGNSQTHGGHPYKYMNGPNPSEWPATDAKDLAIEANYISQSGKVLLDILHVPSGGRFQVPVRVYEISRIVTLSKSKDGQYENSICDGVPELTTTGLQSVSKGIIALNRKVDLFYYIAMGVIALFIRCICNSVFS